MLTSLTGGLEALLLVKELLRLPQDVLELGQLQEVPLQGLSVLIHFPAHQNMTENGSVQTKLRLGRIIRLFLAGFRISGRVIWHCRISGTLRGRIYALYQCEVFF